jgi:hypothetical protein
VWRKVNLNHLTNLMLVCICFCFFRRGLHM